MECNRRHWQNYFPFVRVISLLHNILIINLSLFVQKNVDYSLNFNEINPLFKHDREALINRLPVKNKCYFSFSLDKLLMISFPQEMYNVVFFQPVYSIVIRT